MVSQSARHRGRWLAVIAVALCVLLPAAPAAAHNSFTGSDPADGATLAEPPTRIRLMFLSRLDPTNTKVTVTGPDNATTAGGTPQFDGSRVTVPFTPGPAGQYTVAYQVPSSDGHPITGDITFTVTTGAAAGPPSPAGSSTNPAATGVPPSPADPTSAPVVAEPLDRTAGDAGSSRWPWILALALVFGALAGGALVLVSRRRAG